MKKLKNIIKNLIPSGWKRSIQETIYNSMQLSWKTKSGIQIQVKSPVDWTLYNDIFVDLEYDKAIVKALNKKDTEILDLGANVGFFILRIMSLAKRNDKVKITSIEPDPRNISEMNKRINLQNKKILKNIKIKIIEGVVGKKKGSEKMYFSHNYHMHTLKKNFSYAGSWHRKTHYINLESLCPPKGWDLIKVDIEGSEGDLVKNYKKLFSKTKTVVMEIHRSAVNEKNILQTMRKIRFSKKTIVADHGSNVLYLFQK